MAELHYVLRGRVHLTPTPIELSMDQEKINEMPMVDLAFLILKKANEPYYYPDLMKEVGRQRGMSNEQTMNLIAQLYTEINIDGRFACVGTNLWGLKRWYPIEKSEDPVVGGVKRPRIINDEDDDDLEEDTSFNAESDEEAFDSANDEEDDLFDNDEEDADEDVIVDDEIEDEEEEIEGEEMEEDQDEDEEEEEFNDKEE